MSNKVIITKKGYEKLVKELEMYRKEKRYEAIEAIKSARSMSGEIAENAEYQEAMAEQDKVEKQISILEEKLENAKVVDVSQITNKECISFGMTVTFLDLDKEEKMCVQIVGLDESDFKQGKISYQSPIAKEALGKREGDIIDVVTPSGDRELEILKIEIIDR